jgi:hypothetical protein
LKMKLYIDGKLVGSNTVLAATVLSGRFNIGANNETGVVNNPWNGQIDGVFITNYAMTPDEIAKLYAVGSVVLLGSPKNEGDHVEGVDATNLYMICDTLNSQNLIDILVAA